MRNFHSEHPRQNGTAASSGLGRRIAIRGTVQGVGFRPWVYSVAREAHVSGRVRNDGGGVTIDAFGTPEEIGRFIAGLAAPAPSAAVIEEVRTEAIPFEAGNGFSIVASEATDAARVSIPPDLPVCPACLGDLHDRANRRFHYPFTNCTACGPRFTIATATPYDRPNTTMAAFRMCPDCQREYDAPEDRRFHAEPNACPSCGPALVVADPRGARIDTADPIAAAALALVDGSIVALKGIGGFHLACDATSEAAVTRLRRRKHRDERPFAVMVADLALARRIAVLAPEEERLLLSPERPIVIATRREPSPIAAGIAPGNPLIGIFLPYSPLHHLLLACVRRPLVMTSGNIADEPIAYTDEEALGRLEGVADLFLLHNREIVTRCDDSVARVIAGRPVVLRRSRGYVPRPIALKHPVAQPVLACGALLKNTFCFARGRDAWLGPHIGDLENLETFTSYRESIDRLERFLHFEPAIVAHDLHPDYLSTHYAAVRRGAVAVAVQHHHAHVASVMAEHGVEGPVIGVAYDGTGLGTDGASWGGEILIADYRAFQRVATFRPIRLPGGDAAIRQPWRTALSLADDAFQGDAPIESLEVFRNLPARELDAVRGMVRGELHAPLAHGVGRYFDAMAALGLGRGLASYDGQLALEWNVIAAPDERSRYRYDIVRSLSPWQLDLRAAVRDAVFELVGGEHASRVSARFHNTLIAATADLVRGVARLHGRLPVALSGGCFQNARLAEGIVHELAPEFTVLLHSRVPPGDGGLSLGQAVVADAVTRGV
jgi:hydrogenase maturation protein HypF